MSRRPNTKAPAAKYTRTNLKLDTEAYRRLFVTSVMEGIPASEIVSRLIADHLKGWSMPADRRHSPESASPAAQVSESAPVAA
jgi:hypothetical protein